jgi:Flp pilus assembly protein TadG
MPGRRGERGSSTAESALILSTVFVLLFGIIDFGRAMYAYAFVAQLARQGARWDIVRGSQCSLLDHCNAQQSDIQTYVRGLSSGATNPNNINVTAGWTCPAGRSGNAPGCTVSVTVKYAFSFMLAYLPGASIPMSSTSAMVVAE